MTSHLIVFESIFDLCDLNSWSNIGGLLYDY